MSLPRSRTPMPAGAVALGDSVEGIAVGLIRKLGSAVANQIRCVPHQQVRLLDALQNLHVVFRVVAVLKVYRNALV